MLSFRLRVPVPGLLSVLRASIFLLMHACSQAAALDAGSVAKSFDLQVKPFLTTYCVDCHGGKKPNGDLNLVELTNGKTALTREDIWNDAANRVHALDMPPEKAAEKTTKQPSAAERLQFTTWVRGLKYLYPKDPGRGTIRRLSQVEYANTLHDLLGVERTVASQIPQDAVGEGFTSSISPLLMEKYLLVADAILDEAIKADRLPLSWRGNQLHAIIGGKARVGTPDGTERRIIGAGEVIARFPHRWKAPTPSRSRRPRRKPRAGKSRVWRCASMAKLSTSSKSLPRPRRLEPIPSPASYPLAKSRCRC